MGESASAGTEALLGLQHLDGLGGSDDGDELSQRRLEAQLGYGFAHLGGRVVGTPEVGFGFSESDREYRLGWHLALVRRDPVHLEVGIEATRREAVNDDFDNRHGIEFRATARW